MGKPVFDCYGKPLFDCNGKPVFNCDTAPCTCDGSNPLFVNSYTLPSGANFKQEMYDAAGCVGSVVWLNEITTARNIELRQVAGNCVWSNDFEVYENWPTPPAPNMTNGGWLPITLYGAAGFGIGRPCERCAWYIQVSGGWGGFKIVGKTPVGTYPYGYVFLCPNESCFGFVKYTNTGVVIIPT